MILASKWTLVSVAAVALTIGLTGCGSSSKATPSTTAAQSATQTSSTTKPASRGATSATTGQLHATLHAENHTPIAGKLWPYSVHVLDARGHAVSGTVRIQFTLGGLVVGTDRPPVHPIKHGLWHDLLTFPKAAIGRPLTVQAVVQSSAGSATLNWPVTVKQ
jgi:hypothetical protein